MGQSPTKRSTRKLSEVARHVIVPSGIVSTGWPAVEARIKEFGDEFDEWQVGASKLILAKRENGDYAATVGGITLSIPRQVAKTYMIGRLVFALCTLFPGLTVLWSAHRTRTASKTFGSLRGFALKKSVAPFIRSIRATNGEQEIHFANGSVIMFGAREQGFGRGFDEVDIEVFDEAQILTEKALEDMVAATNQSRFPAGALLFYMGTPPRPVDPGEVFKARRKEALSGESDDAVYIECSADPDADPDDRAQWAKANPSFPHRTPLRSMLRLRKNLTHVGSWMREALGIWDPDDSATYPLAHLWPDLAGDVPDVEGDRRFGVAFSADGMRYSLAGSLVYPDESAHVELIDADAGSIEAGLAPLADWFVDRSGGVARWRRAKGVTISGRAGAAILAQLLRDRGVPDKWITLPTTAQYFEACGSLLERCRQGTISHLSEGQERLDESVLGAVQKQRTRDGAWGWEVPGGDETPVEAVSLALLGARTSRRGTPRRIY
jgi:hypothetical protein